MGFFGFIIVILAFNFSLQAHAQETQFESMKLPSQIEKAKEGTEPVPWPFGTEVPFPWDDINGVWKVLTGNKEVYFSFKVLDHTEDGDRQVNIKQVNPRTCAVTAMGIGYEADRVVRGVMNGRGLSYRISVRAFLDEKKTRELGRPEQVSVLSISSFEPDARPYYFEMTKVSNSPFQCGRPTKESFRP